MRLSSSGFGAIAFRAALSLGIIGVTGTSALATGTITIAHADGQTNVYHDVVIKVIHSALYITSADGKGTIVINRAACAYQDQLMVCLPTSAALVQSGETSALDFKHGTLYVNNTDDPQQLTASTQKVAAHGILLSFSTKRGTYVNLSGRIDKVVK